MKKKTLLLLLWLLLPMALAAQVNVEVIETKAGQVNVVVVETKAGQRMEYWLSAEPRIVYEDAKVTLTTNTTTVDFAPTEVQKVYMAEKNVATDIDHVKSYDGSFRLQRDMVQFSGYNSNELVTLFTLDGKQLNSYKVDADGRLNVSLSQLPAGIYIIKTNHQSIKITKK